jgi:hypothetical protein
MGSMEKNSFLLKHGSDSLLVHMDDIIFGGSSHVLVTKFSNLMSMNLR